MCDWFETEPGRVRAWPAFALAWAVYLAVWFELGNAKADELADAEQTAVTAARELKGKVLCGYQGWFGAEGDGTGVGFDNYQYDWKFEPGKCVIDYWPDMTECEEDEKYRTPFRYADGSVAHVFSSANPRTVDRHFSWMADYGIDGIFLQRFGWALKTPSDERHPAVLQHRNRVLANVRESAVAHKRLWTLMYDLTSLQEGDIQKYVIPDFRRLVVDKRWREDSQTVTFRGRPLVAVWGIGFATGRSYTLAECQELVDFLKHDPVCGGNAVMVGIPYYWRTLSRDAVKDPAFHKLLESADVISPWSVGRYATRRQVDELAAIQLAEDLRWTRQRNLGYLPVVFPGFSWKNLMIAEGTPDVGQQIPRLGGQFLWWQASAARKAGAESLYVAMFDEMNEGTCIFKCSNEPPVGASRFQSYASDDLPEDHYLWLTGHIGKIMRGSIPNTSQPPTRPATSADPDTQEEGAESSAAVEVVPRGN